MNRREFENHLSAYSVFLFDQTERFLAARGLTFDRARFEESASSDIDGLGREVLFYGAQVFPDEEVVIV